LSTLSTEIADLADKDCLVTLDAGISSPIDVDDLIARLDALQLRARPSV